MSSSYFFGWGKVMAPAGVLGCWAAGGAVGLGAGAGVPRCGVTRARGPFLTRLWWLREPTPTPPLPMQLHVVLQLEKKGAVTMSSQQPKVRDKLRAGAFASPPWVCSLCPSRTMGAYTRACGKTRTGHGAAARASLRAGLVGHDHKSALPKLFKKSGETPRLVFLTAARVRTIFGGAPLDKGVAAARRELCCRFDPGAHRAATAPPPDLLACAACLARVVQVAAVARELHGQKKPGDRSEPPMSGLTDVAGPGSMCVPPGAPPPPGPATPQPRLPVPRAPGRAPLVGQEGWPSTPGRTVRRERANAGWARLLGGTSAPAAGGQFGTSLARSLGPEKQRTPGNISCTASGAPRLTDKSGEKLCVTKWGCCERWGSRPGAPVGANVCAMRLGPGLVAPASSMLCARPPGVACIVYSILALGLNP